MRRLIIFVLCILPIWASAQTSTWQDSVRQSSDDSWEKSDGTVDPTRLTVILDYTANNWRWGLVRFQNVPIPQGATIDTASIGIVWGYDNIAFDVNLYGEAVDNSTTLTGTLNEISSKPRTTSVVRWTSTSVYSVFTRSPNIASIIQEIVNRPGWTSGNALSIIIQGLSTGGNPGGLAYDYQPGTSNPKIFVQYTVGSQSTKKVFIVQ